MTRQITQITHDPASQELPAITGDWIVWIDWRNPSLADPNGTGSYGAEIWGYNLQREREYRLVYNRGVGAPRVFGNHLYYSGSERLVQGNGWGTVECEQVLP